MYIYKDIYIHICIYKRMYICILLFGMSQLGFLFLIFFPRYSHSDNAKFLTFCSWTEFCVLYWWTALFTYFQFSCCFLKGNKCVVDDKAIAIMAIFYSIKQNKKNKASLGTVCLNAITNNFITIIMIAIYLFLI